MDSFNIDDDKLTQGALDIDKSIIEYKKAIIERKKHIWRMSVVFIYLLPIFILSLLSYICFYLVIFISRISTPALTNNSNMHALNQFTSLWHIYLILFVVLSTLLGIFVRINMSTWREDAKKESNPEVNEDKAIIPTPLILELFKNNFPNK